MKKHAAPLASLVEKLGLTPMSRDDMVAVTGGSTHTYTGNVMTGDYCDSTQNDSSGESVTICFNKGHKV